MADVVVDASVENTGFKIYHRMGPFWTTPLIGYIVYTDLLTYTLRYRKTVNGGANWGAFVSIKANGVISVDCKADWQIAGIGGTKINIIYIDGVTNDIRYIYLDTATDTVGGDDQILACEGTGTLRAGLERVDQMVSITKTRGGNIAVAFYYEDNSSTRFYHFFTSPDGTTWNPKASPYEADYDHLLLFPANLGDPDDLWGLFHDLSANALSLKTYDDSLDAWAENAIAAMGANTEILNMDAQVLLSNGHLIVVFWNAFDVATADLECWDITDGGTMNQKTNIITDEAESACVSIIINHVNGDFHVFYCSGSALLANVKCFSQRSQDGGTNWDGETAYQADGEQDDRFVSAGCLNPLWGGMIEPWFLDNGANDAFVNVDNAISVDPAVAGAAGPWNLGLVAMPMSH